MIPVFMLAIVGSVTLALLGVMVLEDRKKVGKWPWSAGWRYCKCGQMMTYRREAFGDFDRRTGNRDHAEIVECPFYDKDAMDYYKHDSTTRRRDEYGSSPVDWGYFRKAHKQNGN
jgi:hypothetical protein